MLVLLFVILALMIAAAAVLWWKKYLIAAIVTMAVAIVTASTWGLIDLYIHVNGHHGNALIENGASRVSTAPQSPVTGTPKPSPMKTPTTINGIEQPLAPPRPSEQHREGAATDGNKQSDGEIPDADNPALSPAPIVTDAIPAPTLAPIEIKPTSGTWGQLQIVSNGCFALDANRVTCKVSVMDPDPDTRTLWLTDVEGVDNYGTKFTAEPVANGGRGVGSKLLQGYPSGWTFTFDCDKTISNVAFTIMYSWDGLNPRPVEFVGIPVASH